MIPERTVEKALRGKLRFTAGSTLRERLLAEVMNAQQQAKGTEPALHESGRKLRIVRNPVVKLTSVAAVIAVAVLSVALWDRFSSRAYAIEQTVEALQSVRFLHVTERDDTGQITDERWIEIGEDGYQARYRQQNPAPRNFAVVEDGESTGVYYHDRRAVVLYDRSQRQYQWVSSLRAFIENLRWEGRILKRNDHYQGRPAHRVWWPAMSAECLIDPKTKLPVAIGKVQLSYETPAHETFEITIPEGYSAVDRRPGAAAGPAPQWLVEQEAVEENIDAYFRQGAHALARGDYEQAVENFEYIVRNDEFSNWAWFWLGRAYYGLGRYDRAVERFTRILDALGDAYPCRYCNYARGLAYARLGRTEAAEADLRVCLPAMIHTLTIPSSGWLFEFADNPMIQQGRDMPTNAEIVTNMIHRLRLITGQDFGYDPNATTEENEAAIAAWERWLGDDGQIRLPTDGWPAPPHSVGSKRDH